jgi:maleamate amidohydrolase
VDWKDVVPPDDLAVFEAAGYGVRSEPGNHPALLVIDVTWGFVGREPLPILESIKRYPNSCGERAWKALGPIKEIVERCREKEVPIFYTAGISEQRAEYAAAWGAKHPRSLQQPEDAYDIVDDLSPTPEDVVVRKAKPSVFFGTPLIASLVERNADTVIVTGCTTSGCVRASVVDAFSYGLNVIVVEDGVFDRGELSHAAALFDMDQKYANVQSSDSVLKYLVTLR